LQPVCTENSILISLAIIAVISALGTNLNTTFLNVSTALE
jgi:Flp pilus assembly pilin Flp